MRFILLFILLAFSLVTTHAQTPVLLKDISVDTSGADFYDSFFLEYNGKAYFSANDWIYGTELWVTDGTAAGTERVTDIMPGSGSSFPKSRIIFNNLIYFSAYNTDNGTELWATDGTSGGTFMVKDIYPGFSYFPDENQELDSLPNGSGANNFFIYNDRLFFSAVDSAHGNELWSTDGTDTGTVLVKDICPGNCFGSPFGFTIYNGLLFFAARDAVHGYELWKSDGTANGTVMIKDIYPGLSDGFTTGLWCNYNNKLYFKGYDGAHGHEIWETDGTDSGTQLMIDFYPGPGSGSPSTITVYNNLMYFSATDSLHGRELFRSDGTAAGIQLVKDIIPGTTGSFPSPSIYHNGKLYFKSSVPANGGELWVTDGTDSGTYMVSDIRPGIAGSTPLNLISFGNRLYFVAIQSITEGYQLFGYNDSTGIVSQITPPIYLPNACGDDDGDFVSVPCVALGTLFYPARYDSLWVEFYMIKPPWIGIDEPPERTVFSIYPVPATSTVSIDLVENDQATALVFNGLGDVVIKQLFHDRISFDISSFAPGIFTVQVITTRGTGVKRFVKQ